MKIAYNKTSNLSVAEELVQDCFLTFYNKRNEVVDNPLYYLKSILKYKILNFWRTQENKVRLLPVDTIQSERYSENNILHAIGEKEVLQELSVHIAKLPLQCRSVFHLSRIEGLSNKEIAERLSLSVKTVEAHLTKALKYLRAQIDHNWTWILLLGTGVGYWCWV